ncbi:MAG TPA: RNA 3'-terminal phosphate cyclase [Patescibacteria group bacterium]|nr:RNA 3'-terminal phosphate cyclase [Patescibacteria group bacterium]
MLTIDGGQGEGGGQILRTSLSLSALTGRPFRMINIRGQRPRPGLRAQHLVAVRAVAQLCQAEVEGDELNSISLTFRPGASPNAAEYLFDVAEESPSGHSAGAVTLILQAILWPLLYAGGPSKITIRGGTFVPFSPPYQYFAEVASPSYARFGAVIETKLTGWGWMSAGGGEVVATIEPNTRLNGVSFEPIVGEKVHGIAAVSNLPSHIPHRMARRAHNLLLEAGLEPDIQPRRERGAGPGAGIVLWVDQAGFSALGRKGYPADKVAEAAVGDLLTFLDNGAAVDYHLADQLLLPMALARGRSTFTVDKLSHHTLTNINILREWLAVEITATGEINQPGTVTVLGINMTRS